METPLSKEAYTIEDFKVNWFRVLTDAWTRQTHEIEGKFADERAKIEQEATSETDALYAQLSAGLAAVNKEKSRRLAELEMKHSNEFERFKTRRQQQLDAFLQSEATATTPNNANSGKPAGSWLWTLFGSPSPTAASAEETPQQTADATPVLVPEAALAESQT
jgi:hypothetical protein